MYGGETVSNYDKGNVVTLALYNMSSIAQEVELSTSPFVGASIKSKQERLYTLCHDYLIDNFHKFSEANKIKVALVLASKMAPQQIEERRTVTKLDKVKIDGKDLEYELGNRTRQLTQSSN